MNKHNYSLDGCPRCDGLIVIDPSFLAHANKTVDDLLVELVAFAKKHKINHNNMPVLTEVAQVIQELGNLG